MKPELLGKKYDKIAKWWQARHVDGQYGVAHVENALKHRESGGRALDVGCGAGGRIVRLLQDRGYDITGIDVSSNMIKLATESHPGERFLHQDVCTWESTGRFDFIVAWDSLFHIPLDQHEMVIPKLCCMLEHDGVLIYTFGNGMGEHTDTWRDDVFYYSSIGINENIRLLINNGLTILHVELDQYPQDHVYVVAKRATGNV